MKDIIEPVKDADKGAHLRNLCNLHVDFLRWAFWKVFKRISVPGPGVDSFIPASSHTEGDAFRGLKRHLRSLCDEIDVLCLGDEGRDTREEENVFAIQTPIAILISSRTGPRSPDKADAVRCAKIEGTSDEKLTAVNGVKGFKDLPREEVPSEGDTPFKPNAEGGFADGSDSTDWYPWPSIGAHGKRCWPIAPSAGILLPIPPPSADSCCGLIRMGSDWMTLAIQRAPSDSSGSSRPRWMDTPLKTRSLKRF